MDVELTVSAGVKPAAERGVFFGWIDGLWCYLLRFWGLVVLAE